jgi:hypothetical protein
MSDDHETPNASKMAAARHAWSIVDDEPCDGCGEPVRLTDDQVLQIGPLGPSGLWHEQCAP